MNLDLIKKEDYRKVFCDIWNLMEDCGYEKLNDSEWEKFVNETTQLSHSYREKGEDIDLFFRDLTSGLEQYYERKEKKKEQDIESSKNNTEIDDRTAVYNILQDVWRLTCNYEMNGLSGIRQELYNAESGRLLQKYSDCSNEINSLCRIMVASVTALYARIEGKRGLRSWNIYNSETPAGIIEQSN